MTYLLGFSHHGMNAIISDMRKTNLKDRNQKSYACKSGILFPGCIYGIVGNAYRAKDFLRKFRTLYMEGKNKAEDLWSEFIEHAKYFDYVLGQREYFEIVLSVRLDGTPCFYKLDPVGGLQLTQRKGEEGIHLYGSGTTKLYKFTEDWISLKAAEIKVYLTERYGWEREQANLAATYLTCQLLSEKTLADDFSLLDEIGVGGAFYFIYQTSTNDMVQKPAMYIHVGIDPIRKTGVCYITRVRYTIFGPVFDFPHGSEGPYLLFDPLIDLSRVDLDEVKKEFRRELIGEPYFYYCGIDQLEPYKPDVTSFIVKEDGRYSDIFNKNRIFDPDFERVEACMIFGKTPPL